jgi:hypothetical protein
MNYKQTISSTKFLVRKILTISWLIYTLYLILNPFYKLLSIIV